MAGTYTPFFRIEPDKLRSKFSLDSKPNTRFYDGTFGSWPEVWYCPSDSTKRVNYAVVVGTETAFPPNQNVKLDEITDGLENTILVVETLSGSDKWTEPRDLQFDSMSFVISNSKNGEIGSRHPGGANVGFADGEAHFITCLLYTSPSPRDRQKSRMPSSA